MADTDSSQATGKNFFSTLPGIITAIAGLITAVGGFILVLNKAGCTGARSNTGNKIEQTDSPVTKGSSNDSLLKKGNISYSPAEIKHITRYITYTIKEAKIETLPGKEIVLNIKLKCVNDSKYDYNFYAKYILVKIEKDFYPPDAYSPSEGYEAVLGKGFKDLEYNYKLPAGVTNFSLVFYDEETEIGSSSFTLK